MIKENEILAEPQKTFFIDMLTRDIGITESILDLIDNSIHSLIRKKNIDVMPIITGGYQRKISKDNSIQIKIDDSKFSILDTCGGISRESARNGVFLFGRSEKERGKLGLGLYGVGMKRAFFKLGKLIKIISKVDHNIFQITINVDKWKNSKSWSFAFDPDPSIDTLDQFGTMIEIKKLNPQISKLFNIPSIIKEISDRVAEAYMLFIKNGLHITINGETVESEFPSFAVKRITPARKTLHVDRVKISIIAGLAPLESRTPHGWYVFCNGRMILNHDQTRFTGWGTDRFPQFHSKYNHFIGQVYFSSTFLDRLPWDTTKSRLVTETPVYQAALNEMKIQARPIINTLSKFYPSQTEEEEMLGKELLQDSESVTVDKLPYKDVAFGIKMKKSPPSEITISYKKPRSEVDRAKKAMGNKHVSNRKIGEFTFEYFLDKET
ncbi:MAG: ATP-binding protein [Acidobacteriota bacterium]|nr:ATP-binding protein [Acidobacteriota bacterium]